MLRAFRATAPAELQELLRDDSVVAPDDPVMQELAPLVAAVQTLPHVTRQQLLQLWQATLQLVYGWFTEGFDTADLQEAKTLLDELQS